MTPDTHPFAAGVRPLDMRVRADEAMLALLVIASVLFFFRYGVFASSCGNGGQFHRRGSADPRLVAEWITSVITSRAGGLSLDRW